MNEKYEMRNGKLASIEFGLEMKLLDMRRTSIGCLRCEQAFMNSVRIHGAMTMKYMSDGRVRRPLFVYVLIVINLIWILAGLRMIFN